MNIPQLLTSHVVAAAVCFLGLTAAGGKRPAGDAAHPLLTFQSLGEVQVGATVAEAERATGMPFASDGDLPAGECREVQNGRELPGTAFTNPDEGYVSRVVEPRARAHGRRGETALATVRSVGR